MELDLKELAARESEQVEWKENVADIDDVVATLSAFANDWANLGGGYVVCGAREGQDEHGFARVHTPGLTAARLKEIEGKVMGRCRERVDPPLTPLVREVTGDDPSRRVLVFIMPATGHAHSFRRGPARGPGSDSGKYYIRRSRSTEEARNGLFRELLVRKGALPPWAERPHPRAGVDAIDLLVLRDTLQRISQWDPDVPADEYLDEGYRISEFVPSLCVAEPLTGVLRPRNASLLLFGRDVLGFFPSAYVSFAVYPGPNRSERHSESVLVRGPLFEQVRTLKELMVPHTRRAHDKGDRAHPNLTTYPTRAVDEAIVNALVHRDYEIDDPIRLNYLSPVRLTKAVLPGMLARGKGAVVCIGSVAARMSPPGETSYSASKAALTAFCEGLAVELWDTPVSAHVLHPGIIATELFDLPDNDPSYADDIEALPASAVTEALLEQLASGAFEAYVPSWFADIASGKAANLDGYLSGAAEYLRAKQADGDPGES